MSMIENIILRIRRFLTICRIHVLDSNIYNLKFVKSEMNVKELGSFLYLDSGTLTPLLKKLESKGYTERKRSKSDERNLEIHITEEGEKLREKAVDIPFKVGGCVKLDQHEARELHRLLYKILGTIDSSSTES